MTPLVLQTLRCTRVSGFLAALLAGWGSSAYGAHVGRYRHDVGRYRHEVGRYRHERHFFRAEPLPELEYGPYAEPLPLPGNVIVEVVIGPAGATARRFSGRLDRIRDVGPYLSACWRPDRAPGRTTAGAPQVTLRAGFKRSGALIGPPRVTYSFPPAIDAAQRSFVAAAVAAFNRCTPLPLTVGFGAAIAGVPFAIRLTDDFAAAGR